MMSRTDSSDSAIIKITDLTRRFGDLTAVDHLNLEIARKEIFGLVGPDGAGKTTVLRMLCTLMEITEGSAFVAGHDVEQDPDSVKDRIGYMAQRFGLYGDLTVEENMKFYSDLFGIFGPERESLMADLLKMTRMEPFRRRRAARLSGGMKQKLALMCTLLHRPQILFLDEPTNGVDPVSRREFWAILYRLVSDGLTVFLTTAYLDEAERCNRVGFMYRGRLIRCDTPDALKRELEEECYEVRSCDQRAARRVLENIEGVVSVEPSGATLHMFVAPSETSIEELQERLSKEAVGQTEFKRITPSLEDVFIALARKATIEDRVDERKPQTDRGN